MRVISFVLNVQVQEAKIGMERGEIVVAPLYRRATHVDTAVQMQLRQRRSEADGEPTLAASDIEQARVFIELRDGDQALDLSFRGRHIERVVLPVFSAKSITGRRQPQSLVADKSRRETIATCEDIPDLLQRRHADLL